MKCQRKTYTYDSPYMWNLKNTTNKKDADSRI